MHAQRLFDNFATIAEAPGGADRLRELVVDLAVTGELAPGIERHGTPNGDPGRLGDVVQLISGQHLKPTEYNTDGIGLPYLTGPADFTDTGPVATRWTFERRAVAMEGDVLLTVKGAGIGKLCVLNVPEAAISRQLMAVRPSRINGGYLALALASLKHRLRSAQVGIAIPGIGRSDVLDCPLFVPPLDEQEQIVAKVDELMGLCADLEARRERRDGTGTRFRRSTLHTLAEVDSADELRSAWKRASSSWTALTDQPEHVDDVQRAVLRLATSGRLVEQRTGDSPASALVDQLAETRGRRESRLPAVSRPGLPRGWTWTSFGEATINRDSERVPIKQADRERRRGRYAYYGASGAIDTIDDFIFEGELLLVGEDGANLVLRATPIAFLATGRFWANNHAHVLDSIDPASLRYLAIYLNSIDLRPYLTGIAQPKLNQTRMNKIPVPLPPLEEQRRLVERVEQLQSMCERLKESLSTRLNEQVAVSAALTRIV